MAGGVTRRRLLAAAGGAALGVAAAGGGYALGQHEAETAEGSVPFYGEHQAGIATAAQDRLAFASFDLDVSDAAGLRDLLRAWTDAAALMTAGRPAGAVAGAPLAPPGDTGEALGLSAAR